MVAGHAAFCKPRALTRKLRDSHARPELDCKAITDTAKAREQRAGTALLSARAHAPGSMLLSAGMHAGFAPPAGPHNLHCDADSLSWVIKVIRIRLGCHQLPAVALHNTDVVSFTGRSASACSVTAADWAL